MKRPKRDRVRLQSRIHTTLAARLSEFCSAAGVTENAAVQAALRQYLDRSSDASLLLRRLDRLGRAHERTQRDLELLSEAFAIWLRLWFAHTPTIPDEEAKRSARTMAEGRYQQFVAHLNEQFNGGRRFLDDLPRESLADGAELSAIAAGVATPSGPTGLRANGQPQG